TDYLGLQISPLCPFCSIDLETKDHILLSCRFSIDVWKEVLFRCQPPTVHFLEWSELLSWIRSSASAKLTLLRKLATQTLVFHFWKQRNNLIHNQISIPAFLVFHEIDREMKNIISARRLSKHFKSLMIMWLR
ncbi:hypothetical protein N665_0171s0044, partial [Sinapis alba]